MTFYAWLMKNHRGEDTPLGDLANDMRRESKSFPRATGYRRNRIYLELRNATIGCLDAFEEAWIEYTQYKREQKYARESS